MLFRTSESLPAVVHSPDLVFIVWRAQSRPAHLRARDHLLIVRLASIFESWATTTKMLAASRRRPLRSTLVGALVAAGMLAAGLLLALSVVGLLFAVALGGVLLLAAALGVAFVLQAVHDVRHRNTIILALAIPLVGDALLAIATLVALGAAFHYLVDERTAAAAPLPAEP